MFFGKFSSQIKSTSTLLPMALLLRIDIVFWIICTGENGVFSKTIFLFSNFAKSKMSLTRNNILLALLFKAVKCSFWAEFNLVLSNISEAEITAERGVLI